MAQYFNPHFPTTSTSLSSHAHHGGRARRAPRFSAMPNTHKSFRGVRSMKELTEAASVAAFRTRYEAGRSFDLDDDLEFCPGLLTEDDLQYISSPSSSDRSSLSSGSSPESSPLQQQAQPTPPISSTPAITSHSATYPNNPYQAGYQMKIHQPSALRTRNAIPIVNPSTGMRVPSPPESTSLGMNAMTRRW
ncbi:MAG: hypothetical protein M1816_005473 [Peltula sp. TS41687]|nr:MAG: hypothetical protein M1816_005473 [Peltula sp. TS41687]